MTVRIGIIGTGGIARWHTRHYQATPGVEVVAVCDIVPERARAFAAEFGIPHVDASAAELVARATVDAVSVCTPNDSHGPASIAAARAGKHVLCEKPLALTLAEAREMLAVVEAAGVQHLVNFSKRPFPGIVQLAELLAAGELGEVLQVETSYLQSWLLAPSLSGGAAGGHIWRLDPRVAGTGALGDLGSHIIDLCHHLIGPITRVAGVLETKARRSPAPGAIDPAQLTIDDNASFIAQFANGASGLITASRVAAGTRDYIRFDLYGSRGAARFTNLQPARLQVCLGEANLRHGLWAEMHCPLPPGVPSSLMAAFARGIATGQPATPTFADGVRCQAVMTAVEEAAQTGTWQAVAAT